jgi:hypothetical protein
MNLLFIVSVLALSLLVFLQSLCGGWSLGDEEWEPSEYILAIFQTVFPNASFGPFHAFCDTYRGLPNWIVNKTKQFGGDLYVYSCGFWAGLRGLITKCLPIILGLLLSAFRLVMGAVINLCWLIALTFLYAVRAVFGV